MKNALNTAFALLTWFAYRILLILLFLACLHFGWQNYCKYIYSNAVQNDTTKTLAI
jgi:hypothetical protein